MSSGGRKCPGALKEILDPDGLQQRRGDGEIYTPHPNTSPQHRQQTSYTRLSARLSYLEPRKTLHLRHSWAVTARLRCLDMLPGFSALLHELVSRLLAGLLRSITHHPPKVRPPLLGLPYTSVPSGHGSIIGLEPSSLSRSHRSSLRTMPSIRPLSLTR